MYVVSCICIGVGDHMSNVDTEMLSNVPVPRYQHKLRNRKFDN